MTEKMDNARNASPEPGGCEPEARDSKALGAAASPGAAADAPFAAPTPTLAAPEPPDVREPNLASVRIVLVRPQGDRNLGSVARAMANFGLSDLALVAPRADPNSDDARAMACAAKEILENARLCSTVVEALTGCRWVCGTTARVGERRRPEYVPATAARRALAAPSAAILFGPEDTGLFAEDLDLCHSILTIPTAPRLRSINLAQAVALTAYELWQAALLSAPGAEETDEDAQDGSAAELRTPEAHAPSDEPEPQGRRVSLRRGPRQPEAHARPEEPGFPATQPPVVIPETMVGADELEAALAHFQSALDAVGMFRRSTPSHPMRLIRRFLVRAHPTRGELALLRGISRKILNAVRYKK